LYFHGGTTSVIQALRTMAQSSVSGLMHMPKLRRIGRIVPACLAAYDVRCLFSIADSTGAVLARGASDGVDSLSVSDTIAPPWIVRVYAGTLESKLLYQVMTLP
jgi:hypothetical protein